MSKSTWLALLILAETLPMRSPTYGGEGGPHNHAVEATGDYKVAQWAIGEWKKGLKTDKPLLMTVGFYRPHRPFNAPKAYFEKFPLEGIQLPQVRADDLDDLPPYGKALACSNAHKDLFKAKDRARTDSASWGREGMEVHGAILPCMHQLCGCSNRKLFG